MTERLMKSICKHIMIKFLRFLKNRTKTLKKKKQKPQEQSKRHGALLQTKNYSDSNRFFIRNHGSQKEMAQNLPHDERRLSTQNSIFIKYIAQESNEKDILGRRKN